MASEEFHHTVLADGGLCMILIANILYIVSFVSTAWAVPQGKTDQGETHGYGLWRYCDNYKDGRELRCGSLTSPEWPAWIRGAQAMMALGFICVLLAMLVQVGYICVRSLNQKRIVALTFTILSLPAGVFTFIGIIIYGAKMDQWLTDEGFKYVKLSWGFILANIAVVAIIAAGICGVMELRTNPKLDTVGESLIGMKERNPAQNEEAVRY